MTTKLSAADYKAIIHNLNIAQCPLRGLDAEAEEALAKIRAIIEAADIAEYHKSTRTTGQYPTWLGLGKSWPPKAVLN